MQAGSPQALRTPLQAPNANAVAERWVRNIRKECLDHLVIFGLDKLQHAIDQYTLFYNRHRPHQGIDNQIPDNIGNKQLPIANPHGSNHNLRNIRCEEFLGGLLKSYYRKAV